MESKLLLFLAVVALFPVFQESSRLAAPKVIGTIHIDQKFASRSTPAGFHISSPSNFSRRNLISLKTGYRPINNLKVMIPQQEEPLINHAPISIHNNADFTDQGFPGTGTLLDPYRIEGLNITSSSGQLIVISDTTVYFRITGNYLNGLGTANSAINFDYVIHGTIENNIVVNFTHSIGLSNSSYCSITNNYVYKIGYEGIYITHSENNTISHNVVNDTGAVAGIALIESTNNILVNNSALHNADWAGILLESSNYNQLINSSAYDNGNGIALWGSHFNDVLDNTAYNNRYPGILLEESNDNEIAGNTLFNNLEQGLGLSHSNSRNEIHHNRAYGNRDGIILHFSDSNLLHDNSIANNSAYGIHILLGTNNQLWLNVLAANGAANAYDSGERNQWDKGGAGNYWDDYNGDDKNPYDWIGDSPYTIAGGAGAQDRFPLMGLLSSDPFPPHIDQPRDIIYEENTRGNTITWQASDINPDAFMLWHNGLSIENGTWQGSSLIFKIDKLPFGVHTFTLGINDTADNWAYDTVIVTVTNPKIAASSFIIMIATGITILSIGTLFASRGFLRRRTNQRQDLKRQLQNITLQLLLLQEVVDKLIPPATLQELKEISQDIHPRFEECKAAINETRLAMTRKRLPSFLRPDLAPLERLAATLNDTYTVFTQQYLKWAEELIHE
ncbi:MAG: nitrous oxide reductase family maturation protein NosD [Candidatus Hodarchaeota archaeon]